MSEKLFNEIVKKVLRKESREEGLLILTIGSDNPGEWNKYLKDVVDFYQKSLEEGNDSSNYNIVCSALDFAKYNLVNANLMEQRVGDSFGAIGWMFNLKHDKDDTEED